MKFNKLKRKRLFLLIPLILVVIVLFVLAYYRLNHSRYLVYSQLKPKQFKQINNGEYQEEIANILTNEVGISTNTPDLIKLEKISNFITRKIYSQKGSPTNINLYKEFYEGWIQATNGEIEIHCAHFTDFFQMFAKEAGLIVRKVHVRHSEKHMEDITNYYRHVVLEVLVDGEWVMSDPYLRVIYVKKNDHLLNAYQFLKIKEKNLLKYYFSDTGSDLVYSHEFREMIDAYEHRYFNPKINKLIFTDIVDMEPIEIYPSNFTSIFIKKES